MSTARRLAEVEGQVVAVGHRVAAAGAAVDGDADLVVEPGEVLGDRADVDLGGVGGEVGGQLGVDERVVDAVPHDLAVGVEREGGRRRGAALVDDFDVVADDAEADLDGLLVEGQEAVGVGLAGGAVDGDREVRGRQLDAHAVARAAQRGLVADGAGRLVDVRGAGERVAGGGVEPDRPAAHRLVGADLDLDRLAVGRGLAAADQREDHRGRHGAGDGGRGLGVQPRERAGAGGRGVDRAVREDSRDVGQRLGADQREAVGLVAQADLAADDAAALVVLDVAEAADAGGDVVGDEDQVGAPAAGREQVEVGGEEAVGVLAREGRGGERVRGGLAGAPQAGRHAGVAVPDRLHRAELGGQAVPRRDGPRRRGAAQVDRSLHAHGDAGGGLQGGARGGSSGDVARPEQSNERDKAGRAKDAREHELPGKTLAAFRLLRQPAARKGLRADHGARGGRVAGSSAGSLKICQRSAGSPAKAAW